MILEFFEKIESRLLCYLSLAYVAGLESSLDVGSLDAGSLDACSLNACSQDACSQDACSQDACSLLAIPRTLGAVF